MDATERREGGGAVLIGVFRNTSMSIRTDTLRVGTSWIQPNVERGGVSCIEMREAFDSLPHCHLPLETNSPIFSLDTQNTCGTSPSQAPHTAG